jgi:hypothetical protein
MMSSRASERRVWRLGGCSSGLGSLSNASVYSTSCDVACICSRKKPYTLDLQHTLICSSIFSRAEVCLPEHLWIDSLVCGRIGATASAIGSAWECLCQMVTLRAHWCSSPTTVTGTITPQAETWSFGCGASRCQRSTVRAPACSGRIAVQGFAVAAPACRRWSRRALL